MQTKKIALIILIFGFVPHFCGALQMPGRVEPLVNNFDLTAKAYVVVDKATGQTLMAKNENKLWPPASLTKLVTAMVVLDSGVNLNKAIAVTKQYEVGGARMPTKAGAKYKLQDLLYAALVGSANNAANAAAAGTGYSRERFVEKMNQKARAVGALDSYFTEAAGISVSNRTTAADFVKILDAALNYPLIVSALGRDVYPVRAASGTKVINQVKNTNRLLQDDIFPVVLGKTGFLEESRHNFAGLLKDRFGNEMLVVVLGSDSQSLRFKEAKELAGMGSLLKIFSNPFGMVAGASVGLNF